MPLRHTQLSTSICYISLFSGFWNIIITNSQKSVRRLSSWSIRHAQLDAVKCCFHLHKHKHKLLPWWALHPCVSFSEYEGRVVWTSYKMQTFCTFWTFEHRDLEILPCYNKRSSLHHAFYWFMLAKCSKAKWLVGVFDFIIENSWFSHQQKVRI